MTISTPLPVAPATSPAIAPAASGYEGALHDPALFDKAYAKVRAMDQIQYDFPEQKVEPSPQWLMEFFDFLGRNSGTIKIVVYALLAMAVLYILYRLFPPFRALVDRLLGRIKAARTDDAEAEWQPEIGRAKALLAEADALASEGRYAEAVHYLLWRSIQDIARRRPQLLRPSLTGRDIARSPELPEVARAAFVTIADVVELSHFGRRPVDQAGWERCREAYSRFALRESWSLPAAAAPLPTSSLTGALA